MNWGEADVGNSWTDPSRGLGEFGTQSLDLEYVTGSGQTLRKVHHESRCRGTWCVIHNPIPGPWDRWPTYWRWDRRIMERLCPHGTGHPVAEDYGRISKWELVHGCCGCPCAPGGQSTTMG